VVGLLTLVATTGCGVNSLAPAYFGRVVSFSDHFDSNNYNSTFITSSKGAVMHGYGDSDPKTSDWSSDIKWEFLRHEKGNDIYRIEWTFQIDGGAKETGSKEIAYDGSHAVHVTCNKNLQYLSIEPGLF